MIAQIADYVEQCNASCDKQLCPLDFYQKWIQAPIIYLKWSFL